jgi:GNAT superfamily N-acetyltransferase
MRRQTSGDETIRIDYLAERRQLIPAIAADLWQGWGYRSIVRCARELKTRQRDTIPTAYVALRAACVSGIVNLIECNLPPRCDLSPWLAGLYVWPRHRGRGIATTLVKFLEADARRMGIPRLYLYTESAEGFYRRLGWETIERRHWEGDEVAVMSLELRI